MKALKTVLDLNSLDSSLINQLLLKLEDLAEKLNFKIDAPIVEETRVDVIIVQGDQSQPTDLKNKSQKITAGHQGSFLGILPLEDRRQGSLDRNMFKAEMETLKKMPENELVKHKVERTLVIDQEKIVGGKKAERSKTANFKIRKRRDPEDRSKENSFRMLLIGDHRIDTMAQDALKLLSNKDKGNEQKNGALVYNNFLKKKMKEGERVGNGREREGRRQRRGDDQSGEDTDKSEKAGSAVEE